MNFQIVNVARFARNVIWDFFCDFQTPWLFQDDPLKRPGIETILNDDFMTQGYLPSRLPTSCLTMAPRFDTKMQQVNRGRGPLQEINREPSSVSSQGSLKKTTSSASDQGLFTINQCQLFVYLQFLEFQVIKTNVMASCKSSTNSWPRWSLPTRPLKSCAMRTRWRIPRHHRWFGSPSGWITVTSTALATLFVMKV